MPEDELCSFAKENGASIELVRLVKDLGKLPVVNFAAGGIATPADAALMMMLGVDGVFVGSGIFKSKEPPKMAKAVVQAVLHWNNPEMLAKISEDIGEAMPGLSIEDLDVHLQERGW
jgi:pyridoxal 5'-phosphate synthase pdxS subunit